MSETAKVVRCCLLCASICVCGAGRVLKLPPALIYFLCRKTRTLMLSFSNHTAQSGQQLTAVVIMQKETALIQDNFQFRDIQPYY